MGESLEPCPHGRVTVYEKLSPKEYSSRFLYNLGLANGYGVLIMAGADGVIWHPSTPGRDVGLTFAGCWGHFCRVQPNTTQIRQFLPCSLPDLLRRLCQHIIVKLSLSSRSCLLQSPHKKTFLNEFVTQNLEESIYSQQT